MGHRTGCNTGYCSRTWSTSRSKAEANAKAKAAGRQMEAPRRRAAYRVVRGWGAHWGPGPVRQSIFQVPAAL